MVIVDEIIRESKKKKILELLEELKTQNNKIEEKVDTIMRVIAADDHAIVTILSEKLDILITNQNKCQEHVEPTQAQIEEGKPERRGRGKNRKQTVEETT